MKFHNPMILASALFASLVLAACASSVQKVDLPSGSDPQSQLSEADARLHVDGMKQFDLLSPSHFKNAQTALSNAHRKSEKGESSDKILADVGEALAHLKIVETNGATGTETFKTVLSARTSAKNVQAQSALPKEFAAADQDLRSFGEEIEEGDFKRNAKKISKLEGRYSELEVSALKVTQLGQARATIEKAENNGAKKKAPETYSAAQVQYDSAIRSIEANRRNPDGYRQAVAQSVKSSQKLDQVLKTIVASQTSETAAVQIYDQTQQIAANEASLAAKDVSLQDASLKAQQTQNAADVTAQEVKTQEMANRQSIQALQGANQQYADHEALNQKIESIKAEFTPAEAEVVRDGNKIVIRLKSMQFSTARFELTSSSLETLQKVKEMIAAVPVTKVIVEGHTDSVGTEAKNKELSQKRAESVMKFFVAGKTLPAEQVEAQGFGYEKPLTTNKTKEGRAINRRVDVIIGTSVNM
ncbi:MAG: OmpA family protein [Methylotenera sp.]|nr:OmpA family protein [Oligoflexia bacterium]